MGTSKKAIAIAWVVIESVHDGLPWASDLGQLPGLKDVAIPKAVVWLRRGDDDDVVKARNYARQNTDHAMSVYVYPVSERDPIGRAKRDILAAKEGV